MMKRIVCLVVSILFVLAIFPFFNASADEVQSWIIVDYRLSQDGVNWTSRQELQLVDGAFIQDGTYDYFKIDRIRILNTSNKPSDLFISFSLGIHSFNYTSVNGSLGWLSQEQTFNASNQNLTGYFRYRFNGGRFASPSVNWNEGNSMFFVGQYHISDVNDTACTLTPASDNVGAYFNYSSGYHGIAISIHNVNVAFVGNDGQLYDLNQNLTSLEELCLDWYINWQGYYDDVAGYIVFTYDTLYPFLEDWREDHLEYLDSIDDHLYYLWNLYYIQRFNAFNWIGQGANISVNNTNNFANAINGNLLFQNQIFGYLNRGDWSYTKISLNEINNQMESSNQFGSWFQAVLGAISSQNAIDEHEIALENEALDAGADDVYQGALSQAGTSWGVLDEISGIYQIGDPQIIPVGYQDALTAGLNWYSVENRNILVAPETPGDPDMRFSIFDLDRNRSITFGGDNSDPG